MNRNCFCVTIACMLAASLGCRCGSVVNQAARPPTITDSSKLEAIKLEILEKLGMKREPDLERLRTNASLEERRNVVRMYRKNIKGLAGVSRDVLEDENLRAKQFYSYSPTENSQVLDKLRLKKNGHFLYFNVDIPESDNPHKETRVVQATLRLNVRRRERKSSAVVSDIERFVKVNVFKVTRRQGERQGFTRVRVASRKLNVTSMGRWEEFNLTEVVQGWIEDPTSNYGLVLTTGGKERGRLFSVQIVSTGSRHSVRVHNKTTEVFDNSSRDSVNSDPSLVVYTRQRTIRTRPRRSAEISDCTPGDGETRCCRRPLWVSFKSIGWDSWIIAPEGFQSYHCDGDCPQRYKVAHHHSGIKALVNSLDPVAAPAPCCSATKLSPLSLAHYNADGHAVISVFDDIIVDECKCT